MNSISWGGDASRWAPLAWKGLAAVWLGVLILTPVSLWLVGEAAFPWIASLGVAAQAALVLYSLAQGWGVSRVLRTAVAVFIFTWVVEVLGITSGLPFGRYHYTPALQPQLGGVPLLIPLAWMMMLAPAWGIAAAILGGARQRLGGWYGPVFALLAGLAFTAWDLYLDPQMTARGLWVWQTPGAYFGIPWTNFAGWWLSSSLATLLVRPDNLPWRPLAVIYALTWAFQAVGLGFFWGQPGPAAAGFAGMGLFVGWAWRRASHQGAEQ